DWATFTTTAGHGGSLPLPHLALDDSLDLHVAGAVEVSLAGVFTATAAGSIDLRQGSGGAGAVGDPAVRAGVVRGPPVQATVLQLQGSGSGGGISAAVSLKLVSLVQGANSWLGVEASGVSVSTALDPLSVSMSGGELKLNRASGAGTSKLAWD